MEYYLGIFRLVAIRQWRESAAKQLNAYLSAPLFFYVPSYSIPCLIPRFDCPR